MTVSLKSKIESQDRRIYLRIRTCSEIRGFQEFNHGRMSGVGLNYDSAYPKRNWYV